MKKIVAVLVILLISQAIFAQKKVAEYGRIISDDEFGTLLGTADEWRMNRDSKIYVLINKEKEMPIGRFLRYFYGVESYLANEGQVPKESIIVEAGEEQNKQFTQIWIVKKDEKFPDFKKMSLEEKLNGKITKKILFDRNCIDCDESPFIKQYIFREGLNNPAKVLKLNPNCSAYINIQQPSYYSKSDKLYDRKDRTTDIIEWFEANGISKVRYSIKFTVGDEAKIYIVPNRKKK